MSKPTLYHYIGTVVKAYDGDTCTVQVDLGFKLTARIKVRMLGINTPEIRTKDLAEKEKGKEARDYFRLRVLDKKVIIHTQKKGKFGRWLGTIWLYDENKDSIGESVNDELIRLGYAKAYDGGKRS